MSDYVILFRCFTGPGYWGTFKPTKAYNQQHADQKAQRIAAGYFRKRGKVSGEFKAVRKPGL